MVNVNVLGGSFTAKKKKRKKFGLFLHDFKSEGPILVCGRQQGFLLATSPANVDLVTFVDTLSDFTLKESVEIRRLEQDSATFLCQQLSTYQLLPAIVDLLKFRPMNH